MRLETKAAVGKVFYQVGLELVVDLHSIPDRY